MFWNPQITQNLLFYINKRRKKICHYNREEAKTIGWTLQKNGHILFYIGEAVRINFYHPLPSHIGITRQL